MRDTGSEYRWYVDPLDGTTNFAHGFPVFCVSMALQHKNEVLERHCETVGRDPATIERTMTSPVVVAANDREGKAMLERMPPERRAHVNVGTPDQAAEGLRPYLDAGFTGFTFNNTTYSTPEQIGAIGELLRLIA